MSSSWRSPSCEPSCTPARSRTGTRRDGRARRVDVPRRRLRGGIGRWCRLDRRQPGRRRGERLAQDRGGLGGPGDRPGDRRRIGARPRRRRVGCGRGAARDGGDIRPRGDPVVERVPLRERRFQVAHLLSQRVQPGLLGTEVVEPRRGGRLGRLELLDRARPLLLELGHPGDQLVARRRELQPRRPLTGERGVRLLPVESGHDQLVAEPVDAVGQLLRPPLGRQLGAHRVGVGLLLGRSRGQTRRARPPSRRGGSGRARRLDRTRLRRHRRRPGPGSRDRSPTRAARCAAPCSAASW